MLGPIIFSICCAILAAVLIAVAVDKYKENNMGKKSKQKKAEKAREETVENMRTINEERRAMTDGDVHIQQNFAAPEPAGSPMLRFIEILEPNLSQESMIGVEFKEFAVRADTVTAVESAEYDCSWQQVERTQVPSAFPYSLYPESILRLWNTHFWEPTAQKPCVKIITEDYAEKLIAGNYEEILALLEQSR